MRGLHRVTALRAMNTYWGLTVEFHKFVIFSLEAGELSASNPVHLTPMDRAFNTHRVKTLGVPQSCRGRCDEEVPIRTNCLKEPVGFTVSVLYLVLF
jgi:hypothetical protein